MKKNLFKKLNLLTVIIISDFLIYSLLYECNKSYPILKNNQCLSTYCKKEEFESGECIIDEPITKTQWLTHIIIFEKTNGYISLILDLVKSEQLIFTTISSNNEERIFYAITYNINKYIFKDGNNYIPYIKKSIKYENREMINPEIYLVIFNNLKYIISIGTENSSIDIFDVNKYTNDFIVINSTAFLKGSNRIIKGSASLCYFYKNVDLIFAGIIEKEDESSNYYLTLFNFMFININNKNNDLNLKLIYEKDLDLIKGEYASCFIFNIIKGYVSCFYLSKENLYKIMNIENFYEIEEQGNFIIKNTTIIGSPSNSNDENLYFLKGIHIDQYQAIYCYYSGEDDNIPTFLIKKINETDFSLSDLYPDFPVIRLYDYTFNNNIKYNDLAQIKKEEFYFISTNNDKDKIIISYINIYKSSSENYQLLIRYYTMKLQEYYNIRILNGFKVVNFNYPQPLYNFLTLAIDFCYYDSYLNSDEVFNNAALIMLSYINNIDDINIDFIEYAFENNNLLKI